MQKSIDCVNVFYCTCVIRRPCLLFASCLIPTVVFSHLAIVQMRAYVLHAISRNFRLHSSIFGSAGGGVSHANMGYRGKREDGGSVTRRGREIWKEGRRGLGRHRGCKPHLLLGRTAAGVMDGGGGGGDTASSAWGSLGEGLETPCKAMMGSRTRRRREPCPASKPDTRLTPAVLCSPSSQRHASVAPG